MYIEEVIIDGFKSYATRTTVTGFDPYFNAITGLNGSGKSNILDAICFVLGISNLSQVRVGNLQELVYKHGQAGVTKASVTIIFNNSDKKGSPVGFEHFDQISVTRQVVLGGKNKYVLNGHTVQASQVQNLFHSVQLNVNNPHFLIMQGRITKVLNMKPPEILGMIEEAAGTRMFENKKQAALKTIEKKEAKMQEINKVLATEINPTLERLRGEKKHYMKWSANNTEIEKLERVCVAYQYHVAHQEVSQSDGELKEMEEEKDRMKAEMVELHKGVEERVKEVKQLKQLRDKDYEKAYEKAKAKEEALSKELVKATTVWKNKKASADSEAKAIDAMGQQAGDAKGAVDAKAHEIQDCEGALEVARTVVAEKEGALNAAKQAYQEMCAGVSSSQAEDSMDTGDESSSATLTDLLSTTAQAAQAAKSESAQLQLKISHLEKAIAEAKKDLHKSDSEARKMDGERQALAKAVQDLRNKIKKLGFDEASSSSLQSKIAEEEAALDGLRPLLDRLTAQLQGRLSFDYKDPEARFDRSRVKGLVARLVHLKDPATATALEVVAGSKLYQVVVDNEQTGKLLLEKGGLRRRVTIIPLNKISHNVLDASRLRKANDVAKAKRGQVNLALELVGFDEEVRAAIEHVFGTALVADSLDLAKALAFNKEIGRRTVTLDGDCFDPSGTLTGGSKQQIGAVLGKLQELGQVTAEVEERTARLHDYKTQLAKQAGAAKEYEKLSSSLEVKEHELKLLEERAGQSLHAMQAGQIEEQERELVAARAAQVQAKARGEEAGKKLKQLKAQEEKLRKQREDKLKALEAALGKAKRAHKEAVEHMKGLEQRLKVLRLEMKSLTGDNSSLEEQLASSRAALDKAQEEVKVLEEQLQAKKAEYDDASNTLAEAKKQLTVCDKQIAKIQAENDKANKAAAAAELESKKLENKLSRYLKDKAAARRTLQHMLEKYPWIETERQFFGRRLTDYDFEAMDLAKSQDRLKRLQDEQQKLAKKINKKVVGMIEKVEGECSELVAKLETIENDKKKIESVIEELDVKKNEALETTWVKVTGDFGNIFSSLLPGTSAKLEPPEGGSVLDGLEVKVAFGTVWKESLTELSGGQRSLLALSLILALLLFKPAPMYILDEVDAALDLSHTQNIGAMLRTYFSHSQFIVVSLKEGMFNNANVIFRTRFVDGVSTVTRTLGNGPSLNKQAAAQRNARAEERKEGEAAASKSRKKNKVGPADVASSSSSSASRIAVGQEN